MPLWIWMLIGLGTVLMVWRDHRKEARASEKVTWDCPDGEAIKAFAAAMEPTYRRERWQACLEPWHAPWPWWFLGACLAFAGLSLGAGLWQWGTPDAPVLLVGGLAFGLAATFKAWAQTQAAPAPLRAQLKRLWRSRSRA